MNKLFFQSLPLKKIEKKKPNIPYHLYFNITSLYISYMSTKSKKESKQSHKHRYPK